MITHYDLFAGIGGFSYALDQVFYDQEIKHTFCEWEAFPTAVLKKHWPDGTYYGDIADLVADTDSQRRKRERKQDEGRYGLLSGTTPDKNKEMVILTGGFPCQGFSVAGKRLGTADARWKWPEMFAVIRNVKPDWVIAENVRGLFSWGEGVAFETVCSELESEGYEVWPFVIPAVAVGAPHRRERVWIVAHAKDNDGRGELRNILSEDESQPRPEEQHEDEARELSDAGINAPPNTRCKRWSERSSEGLQSKGQKPEQSDDSDSGFSWNTDWREVAFATCPDGVDDGLPRRLDGATLRGKRTDTISASQHRKERLKACGNAIVPQVAMEIFKSIRATML